MPHRYRRLIACVALTACLVLAAHADEADAVYDAELATRLGADDYGMRSYVLVILKTGPSDAEITDPEQRKTIFAGHFANMGRMAEAGQLVLAGPLMDDSPKRGLFVLNVDDLEAAEELVRTDPAVDAGVFEYELSKWYGSAAVMMINELHPKVQAKSMQ